VVDDFAGVIGGCRAIARKVASRWRRTPPTAGLVTAARLKPMTRRLPRLLPRPPAMTIKPVSKRLLWSGQRPNRILTCRLATAGTEVRGHWRSNRAAIWNCVPPAPPSIVGKWRCVGGQWRGQGTATATRHPWPYPRL